MQYGFAKTYLYVLTTISAANLIFGLAYVFTKISALWAPLLISSLLELIVFIMSIIMTVKVFTKKLNRINLVIPLFYLSTAITLGGYDIMVSPDTSDMSIKDAFLHDFDISIPYNLIMFSINMAFYMFIISFSMYLLRNEEFFRQGQ